MRKKSAVVTFAVHRMGFYEHFRVFPRHRATWAIYRPVFHKNYYATDFPIV